MYKHLSREERYKFHSLLKSKLKPFNTRVKTLTVDNGKEFADHQAIDQALGIHTYLADPYCSWQLGNNENFNGFFANTYPRIGAWKLSQKKN